MDLKELSNTVNGLTARIERLEELALIDHEIAGLERDQVECGVGGHMFHQWSVVKCHEKSTVIGRKCDWCATKQIGTVYWNGEENKDG